MIWTEEAEKEVGRVPFFVRGKVRREVEKEAAGQGARRVSLRHVQECRRKFLSGKAAQPKGFQIETCFGAGECENCVIESKALVDELERMLLGRDLAGFLRERVGGPLKMHHAFRITVSDCPNACSRPQIVDIGIIGALRPRVSDEACTGCGACSSCCMEGAIQAWQGAIAPTVDGDKCVMCGKCVRACPSGAMEVTERRWRIMVGGKLGRHPQLGTELEGVYSKQEVLTIVERCLNIYFAHNTGGERLGAILNRIGYDQIKGLT
jgi:dissimilatory sulfite reductase (desulfoviridin) alpha/beta subunit